DLHAQSETHASRRTAELAVDHVARVVDNHELHRPRSEQPLPVQFTAIQHHLAELQIVFSSAHQSATAGEVCRARRLILRGSLQTVFRSLILHGQTRFAIRRGDERRILHSKRVENALLEKLIKCLSGYDLDYASQHLEACLTAVSPQCAR